MTWKHPSSPVTKAFKVQRSTAKVMATAFWDAKGVILLDILPQDNSAKKRSTKLRRCCAVMTMNPQSKSAIVRILLIVFACATVLKTTYASSEASVGNGSLIWKDYRLPEDLIPRKYLIRLHPNISSLLSQLEFIDTKVGLYGDDALAITNKSARQAEKIKNKCAQYSGRNTIIQANQKVVDFLDVTFS
ncbi:histone-lysine N-methyltransferase SETMAR [Elysia marginata]|uniref:Histone-lysine N-methyltransferase SETMAR n=1 Tax=Elysia marginata TaxID=1093978 RepID=A0AAV4HYS4_9GAST|nr:histone-lysine N-methyltransferase SETMAR [Elysia marginata]